MYKKLYISTAVMLGLVLLLILVGLLKGSRPTNFAVTVGITALQGVLPVNDQQFLKELELIRHQSYSAAHFSGYRLATRYVIFKTGNKTEKFYYLGNTLVHESQPLVLPLKPEISAGLNRYYEALGKKLYGEPLPWAEARELLPKKGTATVTDLATGLSFRIQRRGGTYHADVQPLTAVDTMTMRKIYGGQWSWRRRAVIVEINGRRIAASMNGMPHGAGAIKGNNFPGHFCLHFTGSKVHKSNTQDLAHHLMIAKAAGNLEDKVWQAQPRELIAIFYTALKQHDWGMASQTLAFSSPEEYGHLQENLGQIEDIKTFTVNSNSLETEDLLLPTPITLTWRRAQENSFTTTELLLLLVRDDLNGRWYIKASSAKL